VALAGQGRHVSAEGCAVSSSLFQDALRAIREGAQCSIEGLTLTVNGVAMAVNDEQFDLAWDAMDEADGLDVVRLAD
jgi:invasion protein IalB